MFANWITVELFLDTTHTGRNLILDTTCKETGILHDHTLCFVDWRSFANANDDSRKWLLEACSNNRRLLSEHVVRVNHWEM